MPHAGNDYHDDLPQSQPRPQGTIPKAVGEAPSAQQSRVGMLPTLSIADYKPDESLVNEALGLNTESSNGDANLRFKQPQFGR